MTGTQNLRQDLPGFCHGIGQTGTTASKTHGSKTKITALVAGRDADDHHLHDQRITINVGGVRHDTWSSTLERLPGTRLALLAHLMESDESYDVMTGEFFFDRHPKAFDSILQYYRTEELHVDQSVCGNIFKSELKFWGLEEHEIEACCWADYSKYTEHKETLRNLDDNFAYADDDTWESSNSKLKQTAAWLWRFMEEPGSSRLAKVYAVTSMFFVALSICIFVLETHKLFQVDEKTGISMAVLRPDDEITPTGSITQCCCEASSNATVDDYTPVTHPALKYLDYLCVIVFTLELTIRFLVCPSKRKFFRAPLNIIEVVCLVPHYTSIIMNKNIPHSSAADLVKAIMILRIVRILRIFKLMKHYNAFKILVYTIKVSTKELFLMIVFLMTGVLMFASIIHYTEKNNFPNIPIAIWWALVTMTTVGYGDKYPVSYVGFAMGSVCVVCGVLVIAFTVPIVVNNFSLYYSHAQTRIKVPTRRKHVRQFLRRQQVGHPGRQVQQDADKSTVSTISDNVHMQPVMKIPPSDKDKFVEDMLKKVHLQNKKNNMNAGQEVTSVPHKETTAASRRGNVTVTNHSSHEAPRVVTSPVEEPDDRRSMDSGYDGEAKGTKVEDETRRLMMTMKEADERREGERKRQEILIQLKREKRAKRTPRQRLQEGSEPQERK